MKKLKNLFRLFVAVLLIGGWAMLASALHVVWNGSGIAVVTKERLAVRDTYANVSNWTADDVAAHPNLARRLVAAGKAHVLSKAFDSNGGTELHAMIEEAIARGPTTQPSPTVNDQVADKVEQVTDKAREAAARVKDVVQ